MIIEDQRTDEERQQTVGFITATTYTNWPIDAPPKYPYDRPPLQKHIIVYPIQDNSEYPLAVYIFHTRRDFKNIRQADGRKTESGRIYKPKTKNVHAVHIHKPGIILEFLDKDHYKRFKEISDLIVEKEKKRK